MRTLKFYLNENNNWYADVPEWTGEISELQMVSGADGLLDMIADGRREVNIQFSKYFIVDAKHLILLRKRVDIGGADYLLNDYRDNSYNLDVWLCDVLKFVMGCFPTKIYFKEVNELNDEEK